MYFKHLCNPDVKGQAVAVVGGTVLQDGRLQIRFTDWVIEIFY
jgi:hypothetical protein